MGWKFKLSAFFIVNAILFYLLHSFFIFLIEVGFEENQMFTMLRIIAHIVVFTFITIMVSEGGSSYSSSKTYSSTPSSSWVTCSHCNGTGNRPLWHPEDMHAQCSYCKGTGKER